MKIAFSGPGSAVMGALVVGVLEGGKLTPSAGALDKKTGGALRRAIKSGAFKGKAGQSLFEWNGFNHDPHNTGNYETSPTPYKTWSGEITQPDPTADATDSDTTGTTPPPPSGGGGCGAPGGPTLPALLALLALGLAMATRRRLLG